MARKKGLRRFLFIAGVGCLSLFFILVGVAAIALVIAGVWLAIQFGA